MATPRRGLGTIRTLAGRVNQTFSPYRAYMQITCLEMEKSRRLEEHRAASARIAALDARLDDIDKQKQILECSLQQAGALTTPSARETTPGGGPIRPSAPKRASRVGLRLKY
jgi:hypothetical protein